MTRDQLRSLWLSHAVAGKLVAAPDEVLAQAHQNLDRMREVHQRGQGAEWLAEWGRLLDGPVEGILEALTSLAPRACELRQNSPFAGVMTDDERSRVLNAFNHSAADGNVSP